MCPLNPILEPVKLDKWAQKQMVPAILYIAFRNGSRPFAFWCVLFLWNRIEYHSKQCHKGESIVKKNRSYQAIVWSGIGPLTFFIIDIQEYKQYFVIFVIWKKIEKFQIFFLIPDFTECTFTNVMSCLPKKLMHSMQHHMITQSECKYWHCHTL